ncbi:MAG: lactate racemase domain-containing protein [Desulfobacterales bacterium]
MIFPEMAVFQQKLASMPVKDAAGALYEELRQHGSGLAELCGSPVAVAVGSRRIDRIDEVVAGVVKFLKNLGARPFVVAAMGSHGGATAEGQKALLAGYGITEQAMGVPVAADMDTKVIGHTRAGLPLHISKAALAADHVIAVNRIKPHTKFCAEIESGLCKMLAVGLGNAEGASACHRFALENSFSFIESAAATLLQCISVPLAVGLIEDGYCRLSQIRAVPGSSMIDTEKTMLKRAYSMLATIPFKKIDVLVVDRIGKDISGIGMDSNVTGRHRDITGNFFIAPDPSRIFVRELSPASHGNANGIGLADVTTSRLVSQIDTQKTAVNATAAISPEKAAVPMHFQADKKCIETCIHTAGIENGEKARIVRIRNTASLEFIELSRPLENMADPGARLKRITGWRGWEFDDSGNLFEFYPGM